MKTKRHQVAYVAVACAGLTCAPGQATPPRGAPAAPVGRDAGPPPLAMPGAVVIDPPGRTFVGIQAVKLSNGGPGAAIYYTTDGTVPTRASRVYNGPLMLDASAVLRAYADAPPLPPGLGGAGGAGVRPGPLTAAVFVRVAPELASWSSNLPVIVLHTHESGALPVVSEGPLRPGSITVLEPGAGGRTALVGAPTFSRRAGLRLRGESSLRFPQKSYAVELWSAQQDDDSDAALLGFPADSDFALVGPGYTDRSLIRNALAYAISNQIGRYAPRTRFVEVFLAEEGPTVGPDDYRGVYTLTENIKRGPARVNVARLAIGDQRDPAVTGGYSFRIDKGATHFVAGAINFQYVYPRWEEISQPGWTAQRGYLEGYVGEFLDALAAPDFRNPRTGKPYSAYIDVPSFIDHNLIQVLFKNVDGLRLSAYFYKDRREPLVAGPVWDFDRSSGTLFDADYSPMVPRAADPRDWAIGDGTHPLQWSFWGRLFADPTFKAAHARRWGELAGGPFSVDNLHKLIDRFSAELKEAQARHFARWLEMAPTGGGHQAEVNLLKDWLAIRVPWVTSQL